MSSTFFIGDLHLGHEGMVRFTDKDGKKIRPFDNITDHDETLIANINKLVKPEDRLYFLGDVVINRRHLPQIGRINGRKKLIYGNHDCLDKETECLTKRGWLKYDQFSLEDTVLSINPVSKRAEWKPITNIVVKTATEIYAHGGRGIDMAVTENHRVMHLATHRDNTTDLVYSKPLEMPKMYEIITAGTVDRPEYGLSDDELALLAWIYTDGCLTKYKAVPVSFVLYQSKEDNIIAIRDLLTRLGIVFSESIRKKRTHILGKALKSCRDPHEFVISWGSAKKYLPHLGNKKVLADQLINGLSPRQAEVFMRGLMRGDGSWASNGFLKSGALHGRKEFLESVQILCVQNGIQAYLTMARISDFRLNICIGTDSQMFIPGSKHHGFKRRPYEGNVWCISTEFTNFMVRRNGKSFFTGNCFSYKDYAPYFDDMMAYRIYPKQGIICSHIPVHPCQLENRFKWNVHGHMHSNVVMGGKHHMQPDDRYLNLCPEKTNMLPVSIDDI